MSKHLNVKKSLLAAAAVTALVGSSGPAFALTPFQIDVGTAINSGLAYLQGAGAFSNPSSLGLNSAQGLVMEALLEKRASGNPADPPSGYVGASPTDQGYLKTAAAYILSNGWQQSFYAYRDGAWMMALSGYALTGGPDKSTLAPANASYRTIKQTMDAIVDRTLAGQTASGTCKGFWGYTGNGCDSSTTQFGAAGLHAALAFYQSNKSADDPFNDPARAASITAALATTRGGYQLNAKQGSDNASCGPIGSPLSATERGIGYQATGYNPSLQQTASGIYIQLFGGADVNDPGVQSYMEWIKYRYRYTNLDSMGNSWPTNSYGYYLWSSFKGMELIRQSGVAVSGGNIGPNDYGTLPAANAPACNQRQSNLNPAAVSQPALFGAGGVGAYSAETAGQYFDYAYTLIAMQCANGSFTCTGFPGSWGDSSNASHNAYALLVLQRATGVVVQKCDVNGDGKVTAADLALIRARNGQKSAGPNDPADANGDGKIDVADYRYCALHLTP